MKFLPFYPKCKKGIGIDVVRLRMIVSQSSRCKTQSLLSPIGRAGSHYIYLISCRVSFVQWSDLRLSMDELEAFTTGKATYNYHLLHGCYFKSYKFALEFLLLKKPHYCGSIKETTAVVRVIFMEKKLFDSELKVMGVLWREGDCTAKHISDVLKAEIGWNMNTTYTLIKRCIGKGTIERTEPNFMCHALVSKEEIQKQETNALIDKIYDGSADKLFASLLGRKSLSSQQIAKLKQLVDELE